MSDQIYLEEDKMTLIEKIVEPFVNLVDDLSRDIVKYIDRYLTIRKARKIIKTEGDYYRLLKSVIAARKQARDYALDRWSRSKDSDSNGLLFHAELESCRREYYKSISDLLSWRKKYKSSWK